MLPTGTPDQRVFRLAECCNSLSVREDIILPTQDHKLSSIYSI